MQTIGPSDRKKDWAICLVLLVCTIGVFLPVGGHDFVNFDDGDYVTSNEVVSAGLTWTGVRWAFEAGHYANWHPLTWLSHMLDCQVFGVKAGPQHLVSVGIHAASTMLLYLVLLRMTGARWCSAFVAALFGWHPLHVESVAWISERKDVLSALFFMLTLGAYAEFCLGRTRGRRAGAYGLALFFFMLGLMSKPMLVTLPFVLLLLDFWPMQRLGGGGQPLRLQAIKPLLLEKAPFFALTLVSCVITSHAQHHTGAMMSLERVPEETRLINAVLTYGMYLLKAFWPTDLSVFYPYPPPGVSRAAVAGLVLIVVTGLTVRVSKRMPYLFTGWFWYLGMLVPVIGLVQVGSQSMADRYTYLPLIGIFMMVAWGMAGLVQASVAGRRLLGTGAAVALLACLVLTHRQVGYWKNGATLFGQAVRASSPNPVAEFGLAQSLAGEGKDDEAILHYQLAIGINPNFADAYNNLACIYSRRGEHDSAQVYFEQSLRIKPDNHRARLNYANSRTAVGDGAGTLAQYAYELQLHPDDPSTLEALGFSLTLLGRTNTVSQETLRAGLEMLPTVDLRGRVAGAWEANGVSSNAVMGYEAALKLEPDSTRALNNLAWILATCPDAAVRDGARAVKLAEHACELTGWKETVLIGTLGAAYAEAGRFPEAVATAEKACASAAGDAALLKSNQKLLALYREGKPYRETESLSQAEPKK